jgi:hypothetical protein
MWTEIVNRITNEITTSQKSLVHPSKLSKPIKTYRIKAIREKYRIAETSAIFFSLTSLINFILVSSEYY